MTNREWLNNQKDNDKWTTEIQQQIARCGGYDNYIVTDEFTKNWNTYLNSPHETTADEDFAEIGFTPHNAGVTKAHWFQRECRDYVSIYEETIGYDGIFTDKEIDQIRTIAEKKRKEVLG